MPNEVRLAFAHPSERADAMSETLPEGDPLDRISLRDHTVDVEIGAFQAERGVTQRICFNVVVEVRPLTGPIDDDVDRILSYDRVTEAIAAELAVERLALLETLAERVVNVFCWNRKRCGPLCGSKSWIAVRGPWVWKLCAHGQKRPLASWSQRAHPNRSWCISATQPSRRPTLRAGWTSWKNWAAR